MSAITAWPGPVVNLCAEVAKTFDIRGGPFKTLYRLIDTWRQKLVNVEFARDVGNN